MCETLTENCSKIVKLSKNSQKLSEKNGKIRQNKEILHKVLCCFC